MASKICGKSDPAIGKTGGTLFEAASEGPDVGDGFSGKPEGADWFWPVPGVFPGDSSRLGVWSVIGEINY
jgi:hypothetical protein